MDVGMEWLVEAAGCRTSLLRDVRVIRDVCGRIIDELDLHVVGEGQVHQFPGAAGVTALYLLTESHLACHTYPEHGVATFNLYCCRLRPVWPWEAKLAELLGAQQVTVRRVMREAIPRPATTHDPDDVRALVDLQISVGAARSSD